MIDTRSVIVSLMGCLLFAQAEAYWDDHDHQSETPPHVQVLLGDENGVECEQCCHGAVHAGCLLVESWATPILGQDTMHAASPSVLRSTRGPPPLRPPIA